MAYYPVGKLYIVAVCCFFLLYLCPGAQGQTQIRTYDTLTQQEREELTRLESIYLDAVHAEAVDMVTTFFDTHTIIQTFTPQARIIRQRKREQLNDVLRYLCSLQLEQEFISNYINRLRDDSVDYAVDGMLQKSRTFRRR